MYKPLTPAEHERLTILMEECAEVIQAAAKIQRFGYHGVYDNGVGNRDQLETEIGQLENIVSMMVTKGDVDHIPIARAKAQKAATIDKYLVHQ
jgi:NTP pyrophosphatase (non-canonical NTP hydrolase)